MLANVFSSKSIKDANPRLRMAMEDVAGKAEQLAKAKAKDDPPPPFRKRKTQSVSKFMDWDPKKYATDGKASRDKRAQQRHIRVFGMQQLGMVEYRKLMEEVDQMTNEPADVMALVNKRIEEVRERLEAEEKEKQEGERRQTQSKTDKAGTSSTTTTTTEPTQELRKRTRGVDDIDESRSRTGAKKPKPSKSTEKEEVRKTTGAKKPKPKTDDAVDESENRKKEQAQKKLPSPKVKAAAQAKKAKKTVTEDDDDDRLDDLVIVERKVPDIEEYDDDDDRDEDYEPDEEDDDDFEIPPLRARKPTQSDKSTDKSKKAKPSDAALEDLADFVEQTFPKTAGKKSLKRKVTTKQQRIGESKVAEDTDGTIPLFQQIVGEDYEVMASEEVEQHIMDRCINPVEAAGFRATMKTLALGLKEAVKKGKNIDTTYQDLVKSTIEVARAMRYPGAFSVEVEDILAAIPDIHCNAWRKHLKGEEMMDPKDVVVDDEEEESDDLLIQGPVLGEESTQAAAKAIHELPDLLRKDTKANLVKLFDNQMKAHQYAAEACKNLKELHKRLPLEVFLRIADSAMRPLVILHIPKTEELCAKMREAAETKTRKTAVGASRVVEVMETTNLPQLQKEWTVEDAHKAKKMIACMVYKYVRDVMFNETTATHVIVDKFKVKQTTTHRQLYGKKYPGGGQTLEQMKERTSKTEKRTTTRPVEQSKTSVKKKDTAEEAEVKTSKGKGKGKKSQVKRTAEEIRKESTSEGEKQKAKKRKAEEAKAMEEEDEDRPTAEEIKSSKPAAMRKGLFIH